MTDPDDLVSLTIRELLAELARLEGRLSSRRAAAGYHPTAESNRLERQMAAIRAQLRHHRAGAAQHDHEQQTAPSLALTDGTQ